MNLTESKKGYIRAFGVRKEREEKMMQLYYNLKNKKYSIANFTLKK